MTEMNETEEALAWAMKRISELETKALELEHALSASYDNATDLEEAADNNSRATAQRIADELQRLVDEIRNAAEAF